MSRQLSLTIRFYNCCYINFSVCFKQSRTDEHQHSSQYGQSYYILGSEILRALLNKKKETADEIHASNSPCFSANSSIIVIQNPVAHCSIDYTGGTADKLIRKIRMLGGLPDTRKQNQIAKEKNTILLTTSNRLRLLILFSGEQLISISFAELLQLYFTVNDISNVQ